MRGWIGTHHLNMVIEPIYRDKYIYISAYINTIALYTCLYNCFSTVPLYNYFVCVYTYMCVCVCVCVCVCIYIYIYMHKLAMAQNPVTWPHLS